MAWTGRGRSVRTAWLLAAAGACAGLPAVACAQDQPSKDVAGDSTQPLTGHDFGGVRFKQAVVPGKLSFRGSRVWSWTDGNARRLLLDGDVTVIIGGYRFSAKRAAAWMESVPGAPDKDTEQVFVFFEQLQLGSAGDPAGSVSMSSDRLPVRGVIEVEGAIELKTDLLTPTAPPPAAGAFLGEAEAALLKFLQRELGIKDEIRPAPVPRLVKKHQQAPSTEPESKPPIAAGPAAPVATEPAKQPEQPAAQTLPPAPETPTPKPPTPAPDAHDAEHEPIFSREGIIVIAPPRDQVVFVPGEDENAIIITGGVSIQYADLATGRVLQMTAQRAVIFTDPGKIMDASRLGADKVHAIFLEGDVTATDGTLTVRGPQVCYDLRLNKAFMPDAVFWTYDQKRRLPLYVRAKSLRQESAREFVAKNAVVTNSPFFDPELAIGASTVTITKQVREVEEEQPLVGPAGPKRTETRTVVDARNITVEAMGVPVFYWPTYSGDPSTFPIKDIRIENRSGSGAAFKTTLNAYALLGLKRPGDTVADLFTDYYFDRGLAMGTKISWDRRESQGGVQAYSLFNDRGVDVLKNGARIEHDGEFRGFFTAEERYRLDEHWSLLAEAASVSDPNFIEGFFQQMAEDRREFTNRLQARRIEGNTYFSFQVKGTFDDTLFNEYLLESAGYAVNKTPEAFYSRQADDLLAESYPGLLTYTSEYRAGSMSMAFDEVLANQRGFTTDASAQIAFGINANQSIADRLRAQGLFESPVTRLDTRQELSMQTSIGHLNVNPFVVGRVTYWDNSFDAFSPDQNDQTRLWGAAGVRFSTTMQRIYESVDSSLLDIHRIRHVVEPNATVWVSGTSIEEGDLPVYDKEVEQLADGNMTRVGITQTFQTQRGGPGQWHSVDLLTLSTDFVFSSNDTPVTSPIGRFFDYRPELSNAGNFFVVDGVLRLTDATSLTGGVVYDMDLRQQATSDIGILIRQAPQLVAIADLRYVNAMNTTYLNLGASYQLTDKYSALLGATYDATNGGFQSTVVEMHRRFSSTVLGVAVAYNDISGETSFGIVFQPYGATSEARVMGLGGTDPIASSSGVFR
jgi:hypothetical protein